MVVCVQLPAPIREYADGAARVEVDATTVAQALDMLADRFPPLRRHLFTERGALRGFVNVFLNEHRVPDLDSAHALAVGAGDTIVIVPSIAGG